MIQQEQDEEALAWEKANPYSPLCEHDTSYMPLIRLEVTRQDIERGVNGCLMRCAVALALKRQFKLLQSRNAYVNMNVCPVRAEVDSNMRTVIVWFPPDVTQWIRAFDANKYDHDNGTCLIRPFSVLCKCNGYIGAMEQPGYDPAYGFKEQRPSLPTVFVNRRFSV